MPGSRDLREQLNDLWRTTVDQFDEIKDVILRNSHVGRKKLDTAFLKRQRDRLLQDLGETVLGQVRAGRLELEPAGQRLVERLAEVQAQIDAEEAEIERLARAAAPTTGAHDDEPTQEMEALDADGQVQGAPAADRDDAADRAEVTTPATAPEDGAVGAASAVDEVPATGDIEDAVGDPTPRRRRRRSRRKKAEAGGATSDDEG